MAFAEHVASYFSDFSVTATAGSESASVIVDRETPDVFTGSRTARLIMTMQAGALDLSVGDSVVINDVTYKVLDVDPSDGVISVITLGAA